MRVGWGVRTVGVVCLSLAAATTLEAATINVAANGNFQNALNAAQPGDVITLQPGATYIGNFVLPNKGPLTDFITIRSAAPDSALPPDGVRITPAYATFLPKIKSANSTAALRTAAATNHWRLMFLEFPANQNGYGDIIDLGMGDATQTQFAQVPYSLVLDRVYVHGDPVMGQKRGVALNSSDTQVLNSWISDCKAVGQDTQALGGYNGPGNYVIENNFLEAAGENVLFGGADPPIPNLVTTNITFRRNYLSKPVAWRDPIIATPAGVAAAGAPGGGTLAAGTYYYKVVARVPAGQTTKANSTASVEVSATIAAGTTGAVTISWTPVVGAADYVVYGRTASAENIYWTTANPFFTDIGAAGASGAPVGATKWSVKNIFELKNAQDVLVEGNVFENVWIAAQSGYAICFTPRNQSGGAPWVVVQRITFQHNLVRHAAGGVDILGTDNLAPSQLTNHITIGDNLFDDVGSAWGAGSKAMLVGAGGDAFTIDHNTFMTTDTTVLALYGGSAAAPTPITNVAFTNNMSEHRTYGIFGDNYPTGMATLNAYMPGSIVTRNVLAGGSASKYPAGNFFPTVAAWDAGFVSYAAGDYHLLASSAYKNAGTDGADLGANYDRVLSETANALSGDNRLPSGTNAVRITTATLPDGTLNQAYTQAIVCTGGAVACAWQLADSTLPSGVSFDSDFGMVFGTPSAVQTGNLTVKAYDPSFPANTTTATLTLTIDAPPFVVSMPSAPPAQVGVAYQLTPTVTGAVGSTSWSVVSGALPIGVLVDSASGAIAGVPAAWGTSTALVQAQDSWNMARVDSKPVTITVAPAPLVITTTSLAPASYQTMYTALLNATGGTGATSWSMAAGTLPLGVTLNPSGTISGIPSMAGTFPITVQAVDGNWPSNSTVVPLSLIVDATAFVVSVPTPPIGNVGAAYQLVAGASGQLGSVTWSIASGSLPAGLSLTATTGAVAGVPTEAGTFAAILQGQDSWNGRTASAPLSITIAAAAFADRWTHRDIGKVGVAGTTTYAAATSTFTVKGAGADVWGTADALQYAYVPLTGDGRIVARVVSVQNINAWTKAGVMIRETLTAASAQAFMLVSSTKGLAFQRREATGGSSVGTTGASGKAPYWVRLDRTGNTITAYQSIDGATWRVVGGDTIPMAATVYFGIGVSSHSTSAKATATFDHVTVTQ
jgi:hypothetical protein